MDYLAKAKELIEDATEGHFWQHALTRAAIAQAEAAERQAAALERIAATLETNTTEREGDSAFRIRSVNW